MILIKWVLWRSWFFIHWINQISYPDEFLGNLHQNNFAGCKYNKLIFRDMIRILSK